MSVVLATFRSPWLRDAIESVVAQDYEEWELLVMDDAASTEASTVVQELGDDRIRYFANSSALGPARNHQRGIDEAQHDLVAFINHDDVWETNLLSSLSRALVSCPEAVVSFSDHWIIRGDGEIDDAATTSSSSRFNRLTLASGVHRDFHELAVIHRALPIAQAALMRKKWLPAIPSWVGGAYDFYIAIALADTGMGAVYVPERLARFREHDSNLGLHRSALGDLNMARTYTVAAWRFRGRTRRYAARMAGRSLVLAPRSLVRRGR